MNVRLTWRTEKIREIKGTYSAMSPTHSSGRFHVVGHSKEEANGTDHQKTSAVALFL